MRIIDKPLLEEFRRLPRCEWCRGPNSWGLEPHHIFTRGAGRLDIRINLIGLCPYDHRQFHDGNIKRADLLAIVARREKVTVDFIESEVYRLRRTPKPIGGEPVQVDEPTP